MFNPGKIIITCLLFSCTSPELVCGSAILTQILASLPAPSGARVGMPTWIGDGSTPLANSYLNSKDDITAWLGESIIPFLFQDSVCGDGKCEEDEALGIGRFGWYMNYSFLTSLSSFIVDYHVLTAAKIVGQFRGRKQPRSKSRWLYFHF